MQGMRMVQTAKLQKSTSCWNSQLVLYVSRTCVSHEMEVGSFDGDV
jgi:hypothetical protein